MESNNKTANEVVQPELLAQATQGLSLHTEGVCYSENGFFCNNLDGAVSDYGIMKTSNCKTLASSMFLADSYLQVQTVGVRH